MAAIQQLNSAETPAWLRLYSPPDEVISEPAAHTTPSRVTEVPAARGPTTSSSGSGKQKRSKSSPAQGKLFETVTDEGYRLAAALAKQSRRPKLSPEQAALMGRQSTLSAYYNDVMKSELIRDGVAGSTRQGFVSALKHWDKFGPQLDLPGWCGMPIELITEEQIDACLQAALRGDGKQTYKPSYVDLTRKKLLGILRHANGQGVIDAVPEPQTIAVADSPIVTYTDEEITRAYHALAGHVELQVAFVLAITAGQRPVDLFCLQRSDVDLIEDPCLTFTARKTGKRQWVPLAAVTVAQLRRLPSSDSPYLFPSLSNPLADEPEDSAAAIARQELVRKLFKGAGVVVEYPWKTCRATCNTRLEAHRPGIGEIVLGHTPKGVNAKHYKNRTQEVKDAVNTVPYPVCFLVPQSLADGTQHDIGS